MITQCSSLKLIKFYILSLGSHLSPPTAGAVTSETSELEESQTTEVSQALAGDKVKANLPSLTLEAIDISII